MAALEEVSRWHCVGINIRVGNGVKFVGKVAEMPRFFPQRPEIAGKRIFYREADWADLYSTALDAVSVDSNAWLAAIELGAEWMVIRVTDKQRLILIHRDELNQHAFEFDLGERPQRRIPLKRLLVARDWMDKLPIPYTNDVRTIP